MAVAPDIVLFFSPGNILFVSLAWLVTSRYFVAICFRKLSCPFFLAVPSLSCALRCFSVQIYLDIGVGGGWTEEK